jgi:hypothetical protein
MKKEDKGGKDQLTDWRLGGRLVVLGDAFSPR